MTIRQGTLGDDSRRRHPLPRPPRHIEVDKPEIGKRVRALRLREGMSQSELADVLGTHFSAISQLERGVRGLTIHQVIKLAKVLHVSTDEILLNGASKTPGSLRTGRLVRRFDLLERLPVADQKALLSHLNALLKTRGIKPAKKQQQ